MSSRGGAGGFGGQPNIQQIMKQAQKMQQQLAAAQAQLTETELSGSAGGGLVTVTINGSGELTAVAIDRTVVDPDDIETLQDLIVAAMRDARQSLADLTEQTMGPITGGQGLGGLGGMGGLGGLGLPGL